MFETDVTGMQPVNQSGSSDRYGSASVNLLIRKAEKSEHADEPIATVETTLRSFEDFIDDPTSTCIRDPHQVFGISLIP